MGGTELSARIKNWYTPLLTPARSKTAEIGMKPPSTVFVLLSLACRLTARPDEIPAYVPSPNDVKFGAKIFHSHCAECHGPKGEGGRGPDLTRGRYRHG